MDLELSDEQAWLSEAVETLLARDVGNGRLWTSLVEFGALSVGGEEGLGAVELCLIARALGAHLAPVPYVDSAAVRFAAGPLAPELGDDAVALALLEPGSSWAAAPDATRLEAAAGGPAARAATRLEAAVGGPAAPAAAGLEPSGLVVSGRKVAVEHADSVTRLAVVAATADGPALAIVDADAAAVSSTPQPAFDPTAPPFAVELAGAPVVAGPLGGETIGRLATVGALLAAAEAVGAAGRMLDDACRYAAERRQFGRTIGSFQALRHLLADMYVRHASAWSSVLYAAAALDEDAGEAPRTAAIAKAYVARSAREVAHGAMQVFGGIAVTAEHPAHRFLRRIVVRERRFGDAAHHERALGREFARAAVAEPVS
jgi:alkylation response protein AidB-like acyl-CoA dehydrogenase